MRGLLRTLARYTLLELRCANKPERNNSMKKMNGIIDY